MLKMPKLYYSLALLILTIILAGCELSRDSNDLSDPGPVSELPPTLAPLEAEIDVIAEATSVPVVIDAQTAAAESTSEGVGRNELLTLATLREYVVAQGEYAAVGHDGNPPAFAQTFRSTEGRHDGLFWPAVEGAPESPLGPLIADAVEEGYGRSTDRGQAFHGYHYRILTSQGADAPGGARDYIDGDGMMTRGFAAVAWPATHDNSGIMTFVVNQLGIIFEKDLGTDKTGRSITSFNPDDTWAPASD